MNESEHNCNIVAPAINTYRIVNSGKDVNIHVVESDTIVTIMLHDRTEVRQAEK